MHKEHVKRLISKMEEEEAMDWDEVHARLAKKNADAKVLSYVLARAEQAAAHTAQTTCAADRHSPNMSAGALVAVEAGVAEAQAPAETQVPGVFPDAWWGRRTSERSPLISAVYAPQVPYCLVIT
jgi:hypothetical protein